MARVTVGAVLVAAALLAPQATSPTITWRRSEALPKGRDHHITFLTTGDSGAYLWVAGGNDYHGVFGDVWRLRLDQHGDPVGTWVAAGSLPEARAGAGITQSDRWVVVAGGMDSTQHKRADVFVAEIQRSGLLGPWRAATPLPAPRFHGSLLYHNGWLYATGGLEARVSVAAVHRARLGADGTVGPWEEARALSGPRSHHASLILNGHLCLVGGLNGDPAGQNIPLASISCAAIGRDGSLGEWREVGAMPRAYATHAAVVLDGWIAVLGGVEDNKTFSSAVNLGRIASDGAISGWVAGDSLPAARSHVHQVPMWRDHLYSVGGSNSRVVTGDLVVGVVRKP